MEHGGEFVAAHPGQCVIGSKPTGHGVRDGADQSIRSIGAVPLYHGPESVDVNG